MNYSADTRSLISNAFALPTRMAYNILSYIHGNVSVRPHPVA